jgi:glycerol uptake facilitator-like aquaporin
VPLISRLAAEFIGTLLLVATVVGSGIAASRLSPSDRGLELLENAIATALILFVLIAVLAPISGAHLNPLVSLVDAASGHQRWGDALAYSTAQLLGGALGTVLANLMFGLSAATISSTTRLSTATALAELVATAGLVMVIFVLAWIGGAYFFTSSTSFANPAVTIARILSDTFAGIAPLSAVGFVAAQLAGAAVGYGIVRLLTPAPTTRG